MSISEQSGGKMAKLNAFETLSQKSLTGYIPSRYFE